MRKSLITTLLNCSVILFTAGTFTQISAEDLMRAPEIRYKKPPSTPYYQTSTVKLALKKMIALYAGIISPIDGPRSPSYPTGTMYGKQAIEKHGFFMGFLLTADRLIHESDIPIGPEVNLYGTWRYYDPVESNTFWWDNSE